MHKTIAAGIALACLAAAQQREPDCTFFTQREVAGGARLTAVTRQVVRAMAARAAAPAHAARSYSPGSIDFYLFADMQAAGVTPAPPDHRLGVHPPRHARPDRPHPHSPSACSAFVADNTAGQARQTRRRAAGRARNGWTSGPCTSATSTRTRANRPSTGLRRFPEGRNAFYTWIRDSLAAGKPYNRMAAELIAAEGDNSYQQGELNWLVGGIVTGGPAQDITDQQTANVAETFLGISHVNCLLCHNGRGHLDALSLWGAQHHALRRPGRSRRSSPTPPSARSTPTRTTATSTTGRCCDSVRARLHAGHHHGQPSRARAGAGLRGGQAVLRGPGILRSAKAPAGRARTTAPRWRARSPATSSSPAPP